MIKGDWIKPGAVVLGVGINRIVDEGGYGWWAMSILPRLATQAEAG